MFYAQATVHQTIDQHRPTWAERYFVGSLDAAEAAITRPNSLFEHDMHLDLGGKSVRLFSTPGHSLGHVSLLRDADGGLPPQELGAEAAALYGLYCAHGESGRDFSGIIRFLRGG